MAYLVKQRDLAPPVTEPIPADPGLVSAIRLTASGIASSVKCTIAEIDDVKLAVSEVLLALIEHGCGRSLTVSLEVADSTFAIRGATETRTFDRDHPDLALCETVLAEVCADHSIDVVDSGVRITQAHLHCQVAGMNGPIIIWLAGIPPVFPAPIVNAWDVDGKWVSNTTVTNANIVNTSCGTTLREIADAMNEGRVYANVHSVAKPGGVARGPRPAGP